MDIRIRRVHLEEDTGKLTHVEIGKGKLFAGRPEPGWRAAAGNRLRAGYAQLEEVRAYATTLRTLLRYLGVNSGDMEKGVIRFEANVSIRPAGQQPWEHGWKSRT